MNDIDYEALAERVEEAMLKQRKMGQLIMSGVGLGVPILLAIIALAIGAAGIDPEAPVILLVNALFLATFMHFFSILFALGAFDKSMRARLFNEQMSAMLLEMAQRNRENSDKAKRSLDHLDADYEIVEVQEDGEIAPRRMRSEDS